MTELVMRLIQLGGWPSWSHVRSSSAIRRAGLFFLFRVLPSYPTKLCRRLRIAVRRLPSVSSSIIVCVSASASIRRRMRPCIGLDPSLCAPLHRPRSVVVSVSQYLVSPI
ncbi:hypothetical protein DY000_02052733 [Brassica cretica]|uniref:Uncharacterized protein n=1 Tax=Brassica cretica TaxID=69181 RepID=A0ABQ7A862_BRACR|nr:hypothetical protein DY000_02052733 [Brassica cretica]